MKWLVGLWLLMWALRATAVVEDLAPEGGSGVFRPAEVVADKMLVVSAHPLASDAGLRVLEAGGSALDAAVAVQAMLTLVEPQSSGLGGGAFLLYWDARQRRAHAYDGRETAPMAANEALFVRGDGEPMDFWQALVGGRAVGVPGVVRMLEVAQRQFGRLPWESLFADAIERSRLGFEVTPRLHQSIASGINPGLANTPSSRNYFFLDNGEPLPVGHLLRNEALARTLELIAREGADAFYTGPLAEDMVAAVRSAENPGLLSLADLAAYEAREREPLCRDFRQYEVCSMPPPTSGGVALLQMLGLLSRFGLIDLAPESAAYAHLLTQAARLAYADRARYLADRDHVRVPVTALLDSAYLRERGRLINRERDMGTAVAGELPGLAGQVGRSPERPSTTHLVIVDAEGNALSMTSSIEMAFGSTLMVGGFLLNNQLTDFSFVAERDGAPVANRVQPGKRPRSSMTPVIVLDSDRRLKLLLGSPGGSRIINYVTQALLANLVAGESVQDAVSLPHVSNRNGVTELEQGTAAEGLADALQARGHEIKVRDLNSGLHGIERLRDGRFRSGVDPRREGAARGR
ncbi:gamma-glutamyltransferase [Motiliproteus sediminis]|uniref:gamma-glutamyltransferase n=1 Tax=Motiliproteus sediminis TaxID=1468178 RepID=UPI001AEF7541|nr:gamma-glutamyltransferase [Motiliproteus sediminis]